MGQNVETVGPLKGLSGQLYGYLAENTSAGLSRGLYFNLFIKCDAITFKGEHYEPAVLIDWLTLHDLRKRHLIASLAPQVEGSFYIDAHDNLNDWSLDFEFDTNGWPKSARFELDVNYQENYNGPNPQLRVSGASPVSFTGIGLIADNVTPSPKTSDEALALIAPFFPNIRQWHSQTDEVGGHRRFNFVPSQLRLAD